MKEWFLSREPRERLVLGAGAAIAIVVIAWALVWSPLVTATTRLEGSVESKSRLLTDVRRASATAAPASAGSRQSNTQSLVVLVDRTAQAHGLAGALTRTRPEGANGINITFQNASFDALIDWIVVLEREHGVSVERSTFNSTRDTGLVNGQLFLRRF